MDVPLEIRFHNLDSSDALEAAIRERVAKLDRLYDRLTSCRVAVEARHKQHRKGNLFTLSIEMGVPGGDLVVNRAPQKGKERYASPDVYTAMRDAFDTAERQLLEYKQKQRGDTKIHESDQSFLGQVTEVRNSDDHGFLLTNTGGLLYFHRNSMLDGGFDKLQPGDKVHYIEDVGDTGPIATKVWVAPPHTEF